MNEDFLRSMKHAFDLLRTQGPREATAEVQRALHGASPKPVEPDAAHDSASPHVAGHHLGAKLREWLDHASARTGSSPGAGTAHARTADATAPGGTFSTHAFSNAAGQRGYKLYVPTSYDETGAPLPLVVMLHGCTQNADDFAAGTRMNALAEQHRLIVVYPNQAQSANPSKCWNWFKPGDQHRDGGEPAVIAGITREVMGLYRIDPARVYVAGLSAGGAMAAVMLDTWPDLYAAAGVHSGLPVGSASDLPSALAAMKGGKRARPATHHRASRPVIVFHGDADATVHPSNGSALVQAFDAAPHPATEAPQVDAPGGGTVRRGSTVKRLRTADGVDAEYWLIHGAGHAWAGGSPSGSYTDPDGPDASEAMLHFFLSHPKR
ncbi:PHB depolymerase family esterase [Paraburkholderia sp.]|uniref:extracellular catalytic domain type 1 short-chain-length polyhydroxyalkanoate depolymerase n=1 Tax=Paraburkholderia sp. TaxID=1926495 RepID=UPI0023A6EA2C|nr:PHB depolymerase family esterase [Paraburkholderia sp.]MDE1180140.1 PHB depolymerase family esterase [Paraburkholderia sp.]